MKTELKVGLITDSVDMAAPGISRYIKNLVKSMVRQNSGRYKFYLIHEKKSNDEIYHSLGLEEIIVPKYPLPFIGREIRKIFVLRSKLKKYDLDIVHDLAQVGPFIFRNHYKNIETIYDLTPIRFPKYHTYSSYYRTKLGLPLIINNVDHFITISQNTKRDLIDLYKVKPDRITTIYLASDQIFKKLSFSSKDYLIPLGIKKPYLLFVGTIEPRKNIMALLKAFNSVKIEIKKLQLVIVGKRGWKCQAIVDIIENNRDIIWKTNVKDEDLLYLYNNAEALIFPTFYEGFGLPVLEAMTCGCPVVVSNINIMHEIVEKAGIYIETHEILTIIDAIKSIINNPNVKNVLIEKGLKQAKKFSWEKCAKETLGIYERFYDK